MQRLWRHAPELKTWPVLRTRLAHWCRRTNVQRWTLQNKRHKNEIVVFAACWSWSKEEAHPSESELAVAWQGGRMA